MTFKENSNKGQEAQTDYQDNYNRKLLTRVYMPYPIYKKPKVPFAIETSYNSTFVKYPYSKEEIVEPVKSNLILPEASFSCLSQYKADFVDKGRDMKFNDLNVFQSPSSLMHKVPIGNWYDHCQGQPFGNRTISLFCEK